jgi:hypothetical protein
VARLLRVEPSHAHVEAPRARLAEPEEPEEPALVGD